MEWETKFFGDIFEVKNGLNKGKNFFGKGIPILNYMDVNKNEFNTEFSIKGLVNLSNEEINRYSVKPNDLFFTRTSETSEEIGLSSAYIGKEMKCVFSGFLLRARPKIKINSLFFAYYFRSHKQRNNLIKFSSITTRALITSKSLLKMKINMPSVEEQNCISYFFKLIIKKIGLFYKKVYWLLKLKIFFLQNLFSQKLRFKEFIDDWIKIKLGNLVKIYSGKSPKNLIKDKGKFPYFKVEQLNDCSKFLKITPYLINDSSLLIKKGSVIFPKRGMAIMSNKIRILNQNSFMDTNLMALTVNEKMMNNEFLFYLLINERLSRIADMTSIPQLNNKHINPYLIYLPSLKEQEKIANFLSSIDKKIDLTQNQIDLMENFKKGLLQEMFVYLILYISIFLILLFFKIILNKLEYYFIFHLFKVLEITDKGAYDLIDIILM